MAEAFFMVLDLAVGSRNWAHILEIQAFHGSALTGLAHVTQRDASDIHWELHKQLNEKGVRNYYDVVPSRLLELCMQSKVFHSILLPELRISDEKGAESVIPIKNQHPGVLHQKILEDVGRRDAYVLKQPYLASGCGVFIIPEDALLKLVTFLQAWSDITNGEEKKCLYHDPDCLEKLKKINPELLLIREELEAAGYIHPTQMEEWGTCLPRDLRFVSEEKRLLSERPDFLLVQPYVDVEPLSLREAFEQANAGHILNKLTQELYVNVDLDIPRRSGVRMIVEVHMQNNQLSAIYLTNAYRKMASEQAETLHRDSTLSSAAFPAPISVAQQEQIFETLKPRLEQALRCILGVSPIDVMKPMVSSHHSLEQIMAINLMEIFLLIGCCDETEKFDGMLDFKNRKGELLPSLLEQYPKLPLLQQKQVTTLVQHIGHPGTYDQSFAVPQFV